MKFAQESLILYDFINDDLAIIELASIKNVFINETRLVVVIYFMCDFQETKIILFTHQFGDLEYDLFKPLYIFLIETQK